MQNSQVNLFISYFCKELSSRLSTIQYTDNPIEPVKFTEIVTNATYEALESYKEGEVDLFICQHTLAEQYKDLALKSLNSYSETNDTIEKISEQQAMIFNETPSEALFDINFISNKFTDIQNHLNEEVSRANEVINQLMGHIRQLEKKNTLDPLTKAYNRYALQDYLRTLLLKEKFDFNVFALMIDIDNFKQINDQYGHIAGDKVLIFITRLMKKALRDGDRVFRFGGEEFIVLLNRTNLEGAKMVSERLLNLCRQNHPLFQNVRIGVTLSIGLTKILEGDSIDSLIERSDIALYRAKANGKDRYEMEF